MIALLLMFSCGNGSDPSDTGTAATPGECDEAPVLTWENFGEGFMLENCQSCHAESAPYRDQTDTPPPESVSFDTYEQTIAMRTLILATATGDNPTMPPRGGVSSVDTDKLDIWLNCWETE